MTCRHCGADLRRRLSRRHRYCDGTCRRKAAHAATTAQAISAQVNCLTAHEMASVPVGLYGDAVLTIDEKRARYRQQCADTAWEEYGAA